MKNIEFYNFKLSKRNNSGYPFSYLNILNNYQFYKSYEITMMVNGTWVGLCRLYYMNDKTFELADFFISEDFRGKKYKSIKYYQHLLNEVFKQAKLVNKNCKEITLAVEESNQPAIHIYLKNKFEIFENKSKQRFTYPKKKFIYMKLKI